MAKKTAATTRRRAAAPPIPPLIENDDDLDLPAGAGLLVDEDADKLAEFLSNFGGKEYKVRVEKFNATDKVWEFLDTLPVDGFEPFETCKKFGGGRYRMTFLNEKGKYVPGGQPQIRIAASAVPAAQAANAAPEAADPLKHPMVVMMLGMMEKSNAQTQDLLKAMLAKPEPAKSSTLEVLELMERVNKMRPDDPMKKVQEALMMKMIEKGLDGGGGDPADKSAWQEVLEGLKDVKDLGILDKFMGSRRPAARPVPTAAPTPVAAPTVSVQLAHDPKDNPAPMPTLHDALKPYAAIFAQKAAAGVTPQDGAAYLVNELYESIIPIVKKHVTMAKFMSEEGIIEFAIGYVSEPGNIENLYTYTPELLPHKDWTANVIAEAVKTLTTPEDAPDAAAEANVP